MKQLGLTTEQADAIQIIVGFESLSCADLKEHLGTTHQTASGIVKRLELKRLVFIRTSEKDLRSNEICITNNGKSMLKHLIENGTHTGEKLLAGMEEKEQAEFMKLLSKAIDNVIKR